MCSLSAKAKTPQVISFTFCLDIGAVWLAWTNYEGAPASWTFIGFSTYLGEFKFIFIIIVFWFGLCSFCSCYLDSSAWSFGILPWYDFLGFYAVKISLPKLRGPGSKVATCGFLNSDYDLTLMVLDGDLVM